MTPRQRLEAFLKRTPDALDRLSLQEIGRQTRMSGEYVRLLLHELGYRTDDLRQRREQHVAKQRHARLRAFLKQHPEAVNTPARGGMSFKAIAAQLGISADFVGEDWRALGLPDRALQALSEQEKGRRNYERRSAAHYELTKAWKRRNLERAREIQRAANKRHREKVLRQERCVVCGTQFAWTVQREQNRRRLGTRITCSRRCALTGLGFGQPRRSRVDDERKRAARPARPDRQPQTRLRQPAPDRRRRA
jgi:hypothetical protein